MSYTIIERSLNEYFTTHYPNSSGWFIIKPYCVENVKFPVIKTYYLEVYFHQLKTNTLVFTAEETSSVHTDKEKERLIEGCCVNLIQKLLENKELIDSYGV